MEIFLSHFDSSLFEVDGNSIVNHRDDIRITLIPESKQFQLYMNGEKVDIESNNGLEDLVKQTIHEFPGTQYGALGIPWTPLGDLN